jgi:hypothetical protein
MEPHELEERICPEKQDGNVSSPPLRQIELASRILVFCDEISIVHTNLFEYLYGRIFVFFCLSRPVSYSRTRS